MQLNLLQVRPQCLGHGHFRRLRFDEIFLNWSRTPYGNHLATGRAPWSTVADWLLHFDLLASVLAERGQDLQWDREPIVHFPAHTKKTTTNKTRISIERPSTNIYVDSEVDKSFSNVWIRRSWIRFPFEWQCTVLSHVEILIPHFPISIHPMSGS